MIYRTPRSTARAICALPTGEWRPLELPLDESGDMTGPRLFLLGAPYLEVAGEICPVQRRKDMALLAYLAIKGDPQRRESLAALLWPDSPAKLAHGSLRRTLSEVTQILGGDWMVGNREMVGLNPDLGLWLDVAVFQKRVAECAKAVPNCHDRLNEAISLYRDDFLTGFTLPDCPDFDEWQFFQAEALRQAFATALQNLCRLDREQGAYEAAIAHARRWLALDLLHEPAHCELMVLYAETGQQAAASAPVSGVRRYTGDRVGHCAFRRNDRPL